MMSVQNKIILGCTLFILSLLPAYSTSGDVSAFPSLPEGVVNRIAFGSCAKQWQHQTIWDAVLAAKPDIWLFLGDNIYGDTDGKTAWLVSKEQMTGEWNRLADKPEFQKARAQIPMMAIWDNHDYGSHAGGAEFSMKEGTKEAFLTFWDEPEDSPRWKRPGIYDAKIIGPEGRRVQIILLDTKYNRSPFKLDPMAKEKRLKAGKVGRYIPDNDHQKTYLGEEQWAWLEEQLLKPAEIRLIASSTQVIPDEKGMDEWGNFPLERNRLFGLVAKTNANGVILLSGNVHFGELSRSVGGPYKLYELTSSGMTHINESYAKAPNKYRLFGPTIENNFGLVTIDWKSLPSPVIYLSIANQMGEVSSTHKVALSELQ